MEKMDSRKLPDDALNERRRRAVKLRLAGVSIRETAKQCELSTNTVMHAQRGYERGGWPAVKIKRGHRPKGSGRLLPPEEEQEVQRLIQDRTPDQLKMNYALWTRQAVSELIEGRTGIRMQVRTVGKYLKRWGYTPQKPLKKAYEQSPAAAGKWLQETYPAIAKRAKQEGAEIHWGDETGLRSDDVRGRGYAPKGQTPVLRINSRREGLSVLSTVTNKGEMRWKVFSGALNAKILIGFLARLIRQQTGKIFLILDDLRVHPSKLVKAWLALDDNKKKIEVFSLPSYSPELNPDELLNAGLKQSVTTAAPARTAKALTRTAIGSLRSIQKQPTRIQNYFQHKDVRYAA
jgi:transposase